MVGADVVGSLEAKGKPQRTGVVHANLGLLNSQAEVGSQVIAHEPQPRVRCWIVEFTSTLDKLGTRLATGIHNSRDQKRDAD